MQFDSFFDEQKCFTIPADGIDKEFNIFIIGYMSKAIYDKIVFDSAKFLQRRGRLLRSLLTVVSESLRYSLKRDRSTDLDLMNVASSDGTFFLMAPITKFAWSRCKKTSEIH
jgi:hypothetical protein